jgi:tRNA-splicing ligase RtcB
MKRIVRRDTESVPIKLWLDELESRATEQAYNLASLPFAFKHIAIMPDAHTGKGMPIGAVLATKGQIIPNAVGVDIGCGMRAVQLPYKLLPDQVQLRDIVGAIKRTVPMGVGKLNDTLANFSKMPDANYVSGGICVQEHLNTAKSLGSLGSGNHFIELQYGSDDHLWLMVHSGSRNLGHKVATHYNKLAVELNKKWCSSVPERFGLAHLPLDTKEGNDYLKEMNYCIQFAKANRKEIMVRCINILYNALDLEEDISVPIDIAHNYARMEHHFGSDVMVHRKGATSAREGEIGLIPGSQGTASYIVLGRGNPLSFTSCSHGAGRSMSRTRAKAELNLVDEIWKLDKQGIVHGMRTQNDIDEACSSYKSIEQVMRDQHDLVDIVVKLKPIAVVKA